MSVFEKFISSEELSLGARRSFDTRIGLADQVVAELSDQVRSDGRPAGGRSSQRRWALASRMATTLSMVPVDALSLLICCTISWAVARTLPLPQAGHLPITLCFAAVPLALLYVLVHISPGIGMHPAVELQQLSRFNLLAFFLAISGTLASGSSVDRIVFATLSLGLALVLVPTLRAAARAYLWRTRWWGYTTIGVTHGRTHLALGEQMVSARRAGLRAVALIDLTGKARGSAFGIPVVPARRLASVVRNNAVSHLVLLLPNLPASERLRIAAELGQHVPRVIIDQTEFGAATLWRTSCAFGPATVGFETRNGLLLPSHRLAKRTLDLLLVLAAAPLVAPLMLLLAILVRCTSPGSIFFSHTRIGRGGRLFKAWKFRTMIVDGQPLLDSYLANNPAARAEWALDHKLRNDPRVTRIGKYLRKTSLDELPQLWNVLKGEMSLVGPRPIVGSEVDKYGEVFSLYTAVLPGITGLWQVSGRNNTTYEERVELDSFYVRNWSPWADVHVLARTAITILSREGAY